RRMLALIDMQLRQAFPEYKNEPFNSLSNNGIVAYKHFHEMYKLNIMQRQSGDSEEQQEFRDILLRLRNRESTIADWRTLSTHKLRSLNIPVAKILVVHHRGSKEAKNADSDAASDLETELLLARNARIMLTANL
ncbi:10256_t:CDS:2, partial [Racocetra fulgida]